MSQIARVAARGPTTVLVYIFGALGALLFGYDLGIISGSILFIDNEFNLTPFLSGLVVSSLLVAAAVGAVVSGPISQRLGRRNLIIVAALIFTLGSLGAAFAPTVGVLILSRAVLGIAVGLVSVAVPLYLSEMAPTEIRGTIGALNQFMITVGILAAYITSAALASAEAWRWMLGLAVVPSFVLLLGMLFMPETPRWLILKGREREARNVLLQSRSSEEAEQEIQDIKEVERAEGRRGLGELLAPWVRPAIIAAVGLGVLQQITGANAIIFWLPTTLTEMGFEAAGAIYLNVFIGIVNIICTTIALLIIDRVGRKPMLLAGMAGMGLSFAILGSSLMLLPDPTSPTDPAAIITVVFAATHVASFALTWGPVIWVAMPETLPLGIRGSAMAIAVFLHWIANFTVSQTFPSLSESLGTGTTFVGYAVVSALAFVFVWARVTETKGRSLEQIEADLQGKKLH